MSIIGSIFVRLGLKSDEFSKGIKQSEGQLSSFKGVVGKIGGAIAGAFTVDKIVQFTKEAYKLAGQAQGVYNAFSRLNRPGLLNDLKEATRGTTDELQLMQTAVRASNFKIPLDQLATYLRFATDRAIETGESVDYLVNSLVLGIGRKSPLILDNLSISTVRLREELAKTGDMAKAVGNIIEEEMKKGGDAIETSAVKTQKLGAAWKDFMVAVGNSGAVKSTGNIITDTLTSITRAMSDLIESGKSLSIAMGSGILGSILGPILGPVAAIFGGTKAAESAIKGQRSKQNKIDAEVEKAAKLAKEWADSVTTIEEAEKKLSLAQYSYFSSGKEREAVIAALKEKIKTIKAQEQEKIAREQTEKGIKAQIAALEELRAQEANPEKRAAYTSEIESLKKRLELMTSTNTVVKGSIDYINQQIEAQEKLYHSTNIQSVRDMAAAKKEELEAAKALLEITEKDRKRRDRILKEGDIASGYSTQGMGGSFWFKRVEEKNKLEKNLASYSFDPTLYKDKIQQFKEQAAEVDQVANSIHQTITNTMVSSFQALADGLAGISDMNAGQAIASLLKPLADMAITAGTIIMTTGKAIESLKAALSGFFGVGAIAAGAILVGIGVAARAGLSAIASSGGNSGSSSYSPNTSFSGGGSYSGASSQYGYASYRAQSVDVNVTGRISGQDIVLASDKYLKNKSR